MLRSYPITCTQPGCPRLAVYKIAARWSDGATEELKTYALCCAKCLSEVFRQSVQKNAAWRRVRGEAGERPGFFRLPTGRRDPQFQRCPEFKKQRGEQE